MYPTAHLTHRDLTPSSLRRWRQAVASRPVFLTVCCEASVKGNYCAACGVFNPEVEAR